MKHFLLFLLLVIMGPGCTQESGKQAPKVMPPGSPTQSVQAAVAYNRGVKLRSEDKIGAIAAFTSAIVLDPKFDIAIYNRALTHMEVGNDSEALADLAQLKDLRSDKADTLEQLLQSMPAIHFHFGRTAFEEGDFRKAIHKFTAALLYAQADPVVLDARAAAYDELGDAEPAAADRRKAAEAREKGVKSIVFEDNEKQE